MAFVNEKISDEDMQRIDFSQIKHPLHADAINPRQWTIDRERDIALMSLGGGVGELPHFFVLYWKSRTINVFLRSTTTGSSSTNDLEVTWRLEFLGKLENVPEPEVIATLKEALFVYGYGSMRWRDTIKAIHFEFDGKHLKNY